MGKDKKLDRKLYDAVKIGDKKGVATLLSQGGDPNAKVGKNGMTAMDRAKDGNNLGLEVILAREGGTLHKGSKLVLLDDSTLRSINTEETIDDDFIDKLYEQQKTATLRKNETLRKPENETLRRPEDEPQDGNGDAGTSVKKPNKKEVQIVEPESSKEKGEYYDNIQGGKIMRSADSDVGIPDEHDDPVYPVAVPMSRLALGASVRKKSSTNRSETSDTSEGNNNGDTSPSSTRSLSPAPASQPVSQEVTKNVDGNWEFDRSKLEQTRKLGQGNFGSVFEGIVHGLFSNQPSTKVAIKMLSEENVDLEKDFFKEVSIMKSLSAKDPLHVVRLLAICTHEAPMLMIMELMTRGDLKSVLRDNRPKPSGEGVITPPMLASMGSNIADGMAFLADLKIVHRDLASRNCLVAEDWVVKIGDFGLTRDTYENDYYRMTGSTPLPIRWMSPEAINDGRYTTASDVWSFGIVLWELVTFGKIPYAGFSNMEVCEKVGEEGYRMPKPRGCADALYLVMLECWDDNPGSRPLFSSLVTRLQTIASSLPLIHSVSAPSQSNLLSPRDDVSVGDGTGYLQPKLEDPGYSQANQTQETSEYDDRPSSDPYAAPQDSLKNYSKTPSGDYVLESQKTDVDDQKVYTDQKYGHLDSFSQAVKYAADQNNIKPIDLPKPEGVSSKRVVSIAENEYEGTIADYDRPQATDLRSYAKLSNSSITVPTSPQPGGGNLYDVKAPSPPKKASTEVLPTNTQVYEMAQPVSTQTTTAPAYEEAVPLSQNNAVKTPEPAKKAEPKQAVKYGGATSWSTTAKNTSQQPSVLYSPIKTPTSPSTTTTPTNPSSNLSKPAPSSTNITTTSTPAKKPEPEVKQEEKPRSEHEKEVIEWLSKVLGTPVQGDLQSALKSGDILCRVMNKVSPGSIPKFHDNPKMAFKQMENIGWFLEGTRKYGVAVSDLFVTVDLFEGSNMRQVMICVSALKNKAAANGVKF